MYRKMEVLHPETNGTKGHEQSACAGSPDFVLRTPNPTAVPMPLSQHTPMALWGIWHDQLKAERKACIRFTSGSGLSMLEQAENRQQLITATFRSVSGRQWRGKGLRVGRASAVHMAVHFVWKNR